MASRKSQKKVESFSTSIYKRAFGKDAESEVVISSETEAREYVLDIFEKSGVYESDMADKDFVNSTFRIILGRNATDEEVSYWAKKIVTRTRLGVVKGLFLTEDWANLCATYKFV